MSKQQKAFGLWSSSLTPKMMSQNIQFEDVAWAGDDLVWREQRSGWGALLIHKKGQSPVELNTQIGAQGRVGYGGGSFAVSGEEVFFAGDDGRLYSISIRNGFERPITPNFGTVASPTPHPSGDWVAYVQSDEDKDCIALVDAQGRQWPTKIVEGADFYMQPSWSPDGKILAWVSWDHPQMPWDGSRIEMASVEITEGRPQIGSTSIVAGGEYAVHQPEFSPSGKYFAYLGDQTGHVHLYLYSLETGETRQISSGEFDLSGPAWIQGLRNYVWDTQRDELLVVQRKLGVHSLHRYQIDGTSVPIFTELEYSVYLQPALSHKGCLALISSSCQTPTRVISIENGETFVHARAIPERINATEFSVIQPQSWIEPKTNMRIFGNYYPPQNASFTSEGLPPTVICIHGGPTSESDSRFNIRAQFFTQRGIAVFELNYRGSTGHGRSYMRCLRGNWGVYDVEDAVGAAKHLVAQGLAHPERIAIMGGSAGGYTVLQALTDAPGVFAAGVCLYGVSNLFTLDQGTHKFESEYCSGLIGSLPETASIWRQRSPLFKAQLIEDPLIIFHGAVDKAVPIDQAQELVSILKENRKDVVFHAYPNEGHGWRHSDNIEHFYNKTVAFLLDRVVLC